jgi:hypothetical protein
MATLDPDDEPAEGPDPEPFPSPGTIDLAQFIVGVPGVQHVLQCRFGDHFQGTQTLCTLDLRDRIFAQQKDRDQEIIYYDDHHIYRETDTSPGDHDGRPAFYYQHDDVAGRGAYWCDRFVRTGDLFERSPLVEHSFMDDCAVFREGVSPSQLRVVAYYESYLFDEGYPFPHPVVELAWEINGRVVERYFYGYQRGLVKWVEEERGWKSYLVEEHTDRPPMGPPVWPQCRPRPSVDLLYYREPIPPVPDPEPDPRAYHRVFHLLSQSIEPGSPPALMVWLIASKMRSTCGYSWHDAVVSNQHLLSHTVHTWDLLDHERGAVQAFQEQLFPGEVTFHHHKTDDPDVTWKQF